MRAFRPLLVCLALAAIFRPGAAAAQVELKNDSFVGVGTAVFEGGFVTGEIAASRFTAPPGMFKVEKVRFLFGPGGGFTDVTLHVWDDSMTDVDPGLELFMGDFMITPSESAFQEIDLIPMGGAVVTGKFRVGIEYNMDAPPGIARDTDSVSAGGRNFIRAEGMGWVESSDLGVDGDWILRAVGRTLGAAEPMPEPAPEPAVDAPVEAAAEPAPDAGAESVPDSGNDAGAGCLSNTDCPIGKYCGANNVCTLDCRNDGDCGSGMKCSSLGKCVAGEKKSSGCGCRTPAESEAGGAILLLGLAAAATAARRAGRRRA